MITIMNSTTSSHAVETMHIQFVGNVPAVVALDLRVGDMLIWNGGNTFRVLSKRQASKMFFEIEEASTKTGEVFKRRIKIDRMMPVIKRSN